MTRHVKSRAQRGSHGVRDQTDRARARVVCDVLKRSLFHLGQPVRNGDGNRRALQKAKRLRLLEKAMKHDDGQIVIGNGAVLQRSNRANARGRATQHGQRVLSDGDHLTVGRFDGNGRGKALNEHVLAAADARMRGAEING